MHWKTEDDLIDQEFAYTPWRLSCRDIFNHERQCRRPHRHEGDHASGFGQHRLRWPNTGEIVRALE